MKRMWLSNLLLSFGSAVAGALMVGLFLQPKAMMIRDNLPVRLASYNDALLSGEFQRRFLSAAPTNFTAAAKVATPAVVNIKAVQGSTNFNLWDDDAALSVSGGSGVIISPDGYIVTNRHVIEESSEIEVTLSDKREYSAKIIGSDPSTDIALIKINAAELPHLVFGNSDSVCVGEWVLAVGNPFNLESTVTAGIVSAKGRNIDILDDAYSIESFIQTDAAVNPGNSGGALVNSNGELVGINTAIITRSGRYEGYSFAIPGNLVMKIVRDLKDYGSAQRGILGVNIDNVSSAIARELGLPSSDGVFIRSVKPGGAAEAGGLRKGDVVIGINQHDIKSLPEMQEIIARYRPGNQLTIRYLRSGQQQSATVTLRNKSNNTSPVAARDKAILETLGFDLRNLTRTEIFRMNLKGVYVASVARGSRIERTNMDPGFIITRINDQPVEDMDNAIELLEKATGKIVLEGMYENFPEKYYYAFAR